MSILSDGLNQKASFVGDLGAQQESNKKMTEEQYAQFEAERQKLALEKPQPFPDLMSTMYMDTRMLCKAIGNLLRPIFADYYGARVDIAQNRSMMVSVFFSPVSNKEAGKEYAIEPTIDKNGFNGAQSRIDALNHLSSFGQRDMFKFTKFADEVLRDLIPNKAINFKNGKIDWNAISREGSVQEQNGFTFMPNRTVVSLVIDVTKLLKVLYGDKTSDGGRWAYMVNVGNPINPSANAFGEVRSNLWQLFIIRCNSKDVEEMATTLGFVFGGNDQNIITG
jgi:hypothetical protein